MLSPIDAVTLEWIRVEMKVGTGMSAEEAADLREAEEKPECIGCGQCCLRVPCLLCYDRYGDVRECPLLMKRSGKYVCEFVEKAFEKGGKEADVARLILGVGCGCDRRAVR